MAEDPATPLNCEADEEEEEEEDEEEEEEEEAEEEDIEDGLSILSLSLSLSLSLERISPPVTRGVGARPFPRRRFTARSSSPLRHCKAVHVCARGCV